MSQLQFSLSDLRLRQVPLMWHEAVAIVLEAAEWFEKGVTRGVVPKLGDLALTDDGRLLLNATGPRTAEPVRAFASLLDDLLEDAPAPQELRLLALQDESGAVVHASVEEFTRALAFFARPERHADLLAVSQRAIAELEREYTKQEMERLRTRMSQAEEAKRGQPPARSPVPWRWLLPWAAGLALMAAAGWGVWTNRVQLQSHVDALTAKGLKFLGFATVDQSQEVPLPQEPTEAPRTTQRTESPRADTRGAAVTPSGPGRSSPVIPPGAEPGSTTVRGPAASGARPEAPANSSQLPTATVPAGSGTTSDAVGRGSSVVVPAYYTTADADVIAPVLTRPQLPSAPGAEAAGTEVDVAIDETGRVESVRLVRFEDGLNQRMMVSAVKAWRFAPATRNGVPVKYVKRVRLQ